MNETIPPEVLELRKQQARDRAKAWNAANKERARENQRRYVAKNREMVNEKARVYAAAHQPARVAAVKRYRDRNGWYNALYGARQRCMNRKNPAFKWYGAKGIKCLLTIKDCKILWARDKADLMENPTIDRVDPAGNYVFSNCQFIPNAENVKKAWADRKARGWKPLGRKARLRLRSKTSA